MSLYDIFMDKTFGKNRNKAEQIIGAIASNDPSMLGKVVILYGPPMSGKSTVIYKIIFKCDNQNLRIRHGTMKNYIPDHTVTTLVELNKRPEELVDFGMNQDCIFLETTGGVLDQELYLDFISSLENKKFYDNVIKYCIWKWEMRKVETK